MKNDLHIAYLTTGDPNNKRSWSGIHSYMLSHLQKKFRQVSILGPLEGGFAELKGKIRNKISYKLFGKRFDYSHSTALSKKYAKQVSVKLEEIRPDVIIAPTASTIIANLETEIPIILLSDVVFSKMAGYYESYTNLSASSYTQSFNTESKAIRKAAYCVYPSQWAVDAAVKDHGGKTNKIKMVPFGPNLYEIPTHEEALKERDHSVLRLFFLGVDWERKGGPLVLDTLAELIRRGIPARLTVCGCIPKETRNLPVEVIPFVDKNNPEGEKKICDLFLENHFLFLPSLAECYGIVFVEAAACGCPSISRNTGGISGAVIEGKSGILLPISATFSDYADQIQEMFEINHYRQLQRSSRELFETTHNWEKWADEMEKLVVSLKENRHKG
jgi:glycosyltransferase involved in cell wall biosynthesis